MTEFTQIRYQCFSSVIDAGCERILAKLNSLQANGLIANKSAITTHCEILLYDLLDQIVLPYSVFAFDKANTKNQHFSFNQFFHKTDWISVYPEVYQHANLQLELSIVNFEKSLSRLRNDWNYLRNQLDLVGRNTVRLESILVTASDRHNSGQQVLLYSFDGGGKSIKMLYKPRNLSHLPIIANFFPEVIVPTIYKTDTNYGWQEFIDHGEPEVVAEYYKRAGEVLAVYSAINGTDAHFQNVLACPLGPAIIDWETVFTNTSFFKEKNVDTDLVDFTGLVQVWPKWWEFWRKPLLLNAGLHADGKHRHDMLGIHPVNDGTDQIMVRYNRHTPYVFINRPKQRLDGAIDCLINGFCLGVNSIRKVDWFEMQETFGNSFHLKFRQLIRHTAFYKWLMLQSLNPDILKDFRDDSVYGFLNKKLKPIRQRKDFVDYEISCLMRGDVPIFYQQPYDHHLYDGDGGVYYNFFAKTAHEDLVEKWEFVKSANFLKKNVRLLKKVVI